MDNSERIIPGFAGVIGSESLQFPNVQCVHRTSYVQLFVADNTISKLPKFCISDTAFLWTGGQNIGNNVDLEAFDVDKYDNKFVYVNFSKGKISIYTDHYSKIPLLYYYNNRKLYFSTSLDLLIKLVGKQQFKTNLKGLLFYYNFGFSAFNPSLLEGVKSLSGGQQLSYVDGEITVRNYFNIFNNVSYNTNAFRDNVQLIDKYLFDATQAVLSGNDNNIGIALSGGVDSGYLAQKINECGKTFNAYTIGFKNDYNEFERVDYLSKKLNFKTKKIILSAEDIITNYLDVSKHSSFPIGFNNSILNYIYKEAYQDNVTIMFDGDGADRLFLGMNKYLQLVKILRFYAFHKKINTHKLFASLLRLVNKPITNKLRFYFKKFNNDFPFYGERKLPDNLTYNHEFETLLNDIALPTELKNLSSSIDKWMFFSFFSVYYTPTFFFHTPYELQLKYNLVSNPQFWSDDLVELGLKIPVDQKLKGKTTKLVLREAAKLKIDDGYWNLSKIGLQNSYNYIKKSKEGANFIENQIKEIKQTEDYRLLKEHMPDKNIDTEKLIPLHIWKRVNDLK